MNRNELFATGAIALLAVLSWLGPRFGGSYWETEGLRDRLEELRQRAADYHGNDPGPTEP